MELILIRHAIAEEVDVFAKTGSEDAFRPLTLKGQKKMQKVAVFLKQWAKDTDMIVTSPYTRARQTAEILSLSYPKAQIFEAPELVPQAPPIAFVKWLKVRAKSAKRVCVVGHEPHLSQFASWLLADTKESFIELKKGGVLCISIESFSDLSPGACTLSYLVPPRLIID